MNRRRVPRIWREEGLRVPTQTPKRHRLGISTVPAAQLRAERPNHVWALDFIFDATSDGRPLKALAMCDEFTRENLARRIGRSVTADDVVAALDEAYAQRGAPEFIRCDNRPELVGHGDPRLVPLHGHRNCLHRARPPLGEPLRGELQRQAAGRAVCREVFDSVLEAQIVFDDWGDVYNRHRPHSSLGYLTPAAFASAWRRRTDDSPDHRGGT